MRRVRTTLAAVCFLFVLAGNAVAASLQQRKVAITFDDLPVMTAEDVPIEEQEQQTMLLLAKLKRFHVPAIGFVNEDKLSLGERPDPRKLQLLADWLDAGMELGNHTFSHLDLHKVPLARYEEDIDDGDVWTGRLAGARGEMECWFRHPYLDTGTTLATRNALEAFLGSRGYAVAPVTIDTSDWIFALAYDKAVKEHHRILQRRIARAYVRYIETRFAWYEAKSLLTFGREIPQILLLHADALNADTFDRLARMIRSRGYRFIPIAEAVADRAYLSADTWTADAGVSWIERWGVTRGIPQSVFDADPHVPTFVCDVAGVKDE
jgi:peptidoglycan/xylan/chitin deacetylase (PgdA/CDA1 family)